MINRLNADLKRSAGFLNSRRILIVQYSGDYHEAYGRLISDDEEHYHAARYSVDAIAALSTDFQSVAYLSIVGKNFYDQVLSNGVRSIALGQTAPVNIPRVINALDSLDPTHVIVRTPQRDILKWVANRNVKCLVTLADSFRRNGPRAVVRNFRLARLLNNRNIEWVANHNIAACLSLAAIGVDRKKIVPWDWPHAISIKNQAKELNAFPDPIRLLYVGSISESKGVGDLLRAAKVLVGDGVAFELAIVGEDTGYKMQALARRLDVSSAVTFLGSIPRNEAQRKMEQADIVVIPSRHDYPEGLPLTIYEALAARTPIVASDHPMFAGTLRHGENALTFPASNPTRLAAALRRLINDPELRSLFSSRSISSWHAIQVPLKWGDLVARWVHGTPHDHDWINGHCLDSGLYDQRLARQRKPD